MDDPLLLTPTGVAILEEDDDFTEFEANPKDDGIVLAQPTAVDKLVVLLTPSANTPT